MRRRLRHLLALRRRVLAAAVVATLGITAGVLAYWAASGSGTASGSVGTLAAPSISSATPGAGTVELSWSGVTPPGTGEVTYNVSRDGGAPSGSCASSASPSAATSCTDSGVSPGNHTYTVTARWLSWTATSAPQSVEVAFATATHLVLSASTTTPTAGAGDTLTIMAKDASDNTVMSYAGSKTLTFSGAGAIGPNQATVTNSFGSAVNFGTGTAITFTNGVATVSGSDNGVMTLYRAESASVIVTDGSISNGAGLSVTVGAAQASSFALPTPATQTAGAAFAEALTAKDAYGNTATGYSGAKTIVFSGPSSSPNSTASSYPASVSFSSGVGAASITLYKAESTSLTAKDGSIIGTSGSFTVSAAGASSFTVPTPGTQTAGTAFEEALTALDAYGNTATGYSGSTTIAFSGPSSSPNSTAPKYPASVSFTSGVGTASITLYKAESTKLTAKEGSITGSSGSFTVNPAGAATFTVANPGTQTAGAAFSETLTALDEYGNAAKGYTGEKTIAFSGPAESPNKTKPTYPASVSFVEGAGKATITLYDAQSTTLAAKDGSISGASVAFTISPTSIASIAIGNPGSQTAGTEFKLTITATDTYGNGVAGSQAFIFSGPSESPNKTKPSYPASVSFASGEGKAPVTLPDAQKTAITVKQGAVSGTGAELTVNAAPIASIAVENPGPQTASTAFKLSATAKDTFGNAASGSESLEFSGPSNAPDGAVPSYPTSATFVNGSASPEMTLFDAQSTTITVRHGTATGTSTTFEVKAGSARGLTYTSATNKSGSITPSCSGSVTALTCKALGKTTGNSRFFKANISLIDAHQNIATNTSGSEISVSVTQTGGSSISPTSVGIANGTSKSTAQFELKLNNGESTGIVKASATVNATAVTSACEAN